MDDDDHPLGGEKMGEDAAFDAFEPSDPMIHIQESYLRALQERISALESGMELLLRVHEGQMATNLHTSRLMRRLGELAFGKPKI